MASYPPIFVTIDGVLFNATDIQKARPVDPHEFASGVKVFFLSGGWTILPNVTIEELEAVLASAAKEAAPF